MKTLIKLTESDLINLVKRVIKEQSSDSVINVKKISEFNYHRKPKIYKRDDFISLNWSNPEDPSDNNISVQYPNREDSNLFTIIVTTKYNNTPFCNNISQIKSLLEEKFNPSKITKFPNECGFAGDFNISDKENIPNIVAFISSQIYKKK